MRKLSAKDTLYKVIAVTELGVGYNLTGVITELNWDDTEGELARKALISIYNAKIGENTWLTNVLDISSNIVIYALDGQEWKVILTSGVWEWDYNSSSKKELSMVTYENSFYMTRSSGNFYKSKGLDTKTLVEEICNQAGIKVKYDFKSINHQAVKYQNKKYSDMVGELLKEVTEQTGEKYVIKMEDDTLVISYRGDINMYKITVNNTESVKHKVSKMDMITKVQVTSSKSGADKEPGVIETAKGDTERFGEITMIIPEAKKEDGKSASEQAAEILKEKGKPKVEVTVGPIPDYPFLRKGELIDLEAGNQIGKFYILSANHDAMKQTMTLELEEKIDE